MIDEEPCPMHLTQKPKQRTGASLATKVYSEIAFGCPPAFETAKPDEAEQQKTIISHLKSGSRHIVIDNWPQGKVFDDATVASLVTAYMYKGRLLGTNEFVCAPWTGVFDVNGNNVQLSDELRERTLLVRLDAAMENPNDRKGFKHPDLIAWVKSNRPQLVHAVLVLAQAWIARERSLGPERRSVGSKPIAGSLAASLRAQVSAGFLGNRELLRHRSVRATMPSKASSRFGGTSGKSFALKSVHLITAPRRVITSRAITARFAKSRPCSTFT